MSFDEIVKAENVATGVTKQEADGEGARLRNTADELDNLPQ